MFDFFFFCKALGHCSVRTLKTKSTEMWRAVCGVPYCRVPKYYIAGRTDAPQLRMGTRLACSFMPASEGLSDERIV